MMFIAASWYIIIWMSRYSTTAVDRPQHNPVPEPLSLKSILSPETDQVSATETTEVPIGWSKIAPPHNSSAPAQTAGGSLKINYTISMAGVALLLTAAANVAAPSTAQLTIIGLLALTLTGLYTVWVFFQKMYQTSKWTNEAARFARIVIQAFWSIEVGTFSVFTYLTMTRPALPMYGVLNQASTSANASELVSMAADSLGLLAATTSLFVVKLVRRAKTKQLTLLLLTVCASITTLTLFREIAAAVHASCLLDELKVSAVNSLEERSSSAAERAETSLALLGELRGSLSLVETTHEADTAVFYSLLLIFLKVLHSGFVLAILTLTSFRFYKTSELSYHSIAALVINSTCLAVLCTLGKLPLAVSELELFSSTFSNVYEGQTLEHLTQAVSFSVALECGTGLGLT